MHGDFWDQDRIEALLQLHDPDRGVIVMPARPGKIGPLHAVLDVLVAVGKGVSLGGPPSEISCASELATTWLAAEQVQVVVVVGVDRWPLRTQRVIEDAVAGSGAAFVPLPTTARAQDFKIAIMTATHARRKAATGWPDEWRTLRDYRLPHFPVATYAQGIGITWPELLKARVDDVGNGGSTLALPGGIAAIPAGVDRCVRAQELHSRSYGRAKLMTSFGRILRRDELAYAALKGYFAVA